MKHRLRANSAGTLLDCLRSSLDLSFKQGKRLLDQKCVWVNRELVWIAKHSLRPHDEVVVFDDPLHAGEKNPDILFEDPHLVVFNKRPYIAVTGNKSLEPWLRRIRKEDRLRAVHRLDKETSGCLLFARTPVAQQALLALFRDRNIEKRYEVVVHGRVPWKQQRFTQRLDGRSAISDAKCLATSKTFSHLAVDIETGRKHQIRRHLAAAGFPVLGDKLYSQSKGEAPRHMLHAAQVRFTHPVTDENLFIEAPPPEDFQSAVNAVRSTNEP